VLVAAAPTFAPTLAVQGAKEDTFTTAPTKCSMFGLRHDSNILKLDSTCSGMNTITSKSYTFEDSNRYITNVTRPSLFDMMMVPPLATRMLNI
jgi:hypothetical protein